MKQTTAQQLRQIGGPYASEVNRLTGLSREGIAELIWDAGNWWLWQEQLEHLAHARAFWADFKYEWYARDGEFIAECYRRGAVINYKQFHYKKLREYSLDQAVVSKIREQLKSESYG